MNVLCQKITKMYILPRKLNYLKISQSTVLKTKVLKYRRKERSLKIRNIIRNYKRLSSVMFAWEENSSETFYYIFKIFTKTLLDVQKISFEFSIFKILSMKLLFLTSKSCRNGKILSLIVKVVEIYRKLI